MNFFNIGLGEFFLIIVLAMIIFGPQRLPELFRRLGKALRDVREFARNIDPELLEDFRTITHEIDTVRSEMSSFRNDLVDVQRELAGAAKDVTDGVNEAVKGVTDVHSAVKAAGTTAAVSTGAVPAAISAGSAGGAPLPAAAVSTVSTASTPSGALRPASTLASPAPTAVPTLAQAAASTAPDMVGEIVGRALPLHGAGDGSYLDEIVGLKTFPLPRGATHTRPAQARNGHDRPQAPRSRQAVMVSLSRPAAPQPARAPAPLRATPMRRAGPAPVRRTRRG